MEAECGSPLLSGDNSGVFGDPDEEARQYFEAFAKWDSEGEAGSDLEPAAAVALQCHLQGLDYTVFQQDFKSYSQQSVNLSANGEASGPLELGRYLAIVNSAAGEAEGQLVNVGQALEVDIPDAGLAGKIALIERGTITAQEKARRVEDAGAVAAIIYNDEDDGLFGTGLTNTETLPTIPVLALEGRLGSRLSRILATEDVVVSLDVSYIDTWSINVVAEKTGSEPNDKLVIIGAAYSYIFGTAVPGLIDHTGLVTLMTIAKAIAEMEYPFAVTFALWGAADYPSEYVTQGDEHFVSSMSESRKANTIAVIEFREISSNSPIYVAGEAALKRSILSTGADTGIALEPGIELGPDYYSDKPLTFRGNGIPYVSMWAHGVSSRHSSQEPPWAMHRMGIAETVDIILAFLDKLADQENESALESSQRTGTS